MEKQANVSVSTGADGNLSAHAKHQAAVQHELHMQHAKVMQKAEVMKKAAGNASVAGATVKRETKKIYNSSQNKPSRANLSRLVTPSKAMFRSSLSGNSTKPVISENDALRLIARNAAKRKAGK